ncbi:ATPase [Methanotorris formicicus Mc-S-70]|uniref:ATPase n=2 Tax=Methanotorris formicicus TaxID=213185 RepID=H1KZC0_9EURY|nr:ATPase [Methanotorris formicicus Mc-S-70]
MVNKMKFFNREKEINEILYILNKEPDDIYFIYGSINSGKTALINEVINNRLDKYVVFYINLRGYFISKYDDFIRVLFKTYTPKKSFLDRIKNILKPLIKDSPNFIDIPSIASITSNVLTGIPIPKNLLNQLLKDKNSDDVFNYLTEIFLEVKKYGKQPVLIIDVLETFGFQNLCRFAPKNLQKIGDLKLNGFLIYELFNYFIDLTKELHLCHVFCLSSDSLFIEKVYNEAMLDGRAKYLLVDDFDKETALKFMDFLAEENNIKLTNEDKGLIYSYVGGKPKDIKYVVEEIKFKELKEVLDYLLKDTIQRLKYFLEDVKEEDEEFYNKIVEALKLFKESYEIEDIAINKKVREFLVKRNILFLNPQKGILKPQSFLVWNAIKRVL